MRRERWRGQGRGARTAQGRPGSRPRTLRPQSVCLRGVGEAPVLAESGSTQLTGVSSSGASPRLGAEESACQYRGGVFNP